MKRMIALIACFILSSFAAAAQTEWVTFSSPEGRFSLQFPEKPTAEVNHAIADKPTMYSFTAKSRTIGCFASYADYRVSDGQQQSALDNIRNAIVSNNGGRLLDETKISINGNPGRQLLMSKTTENGSELIYHSRMYLVGSRLYQIVAIYLKGDSQSPELPKYFDSFRLLN